MTSPRAPPIGLPTFRLSSQASSSVFFLIRSANLARVRPRLPAAQFAQPLRSSNALLRRGHGPVDVLAATERRRGDHLAGRGVDDLEGLAVRGVDGLAADDHPGGRRGVGGARRARCSVVIGGPRLGGGGATPRSQWRHDTPAARHPPRRRSRAARGSLHSADRPDVGRRASTRGRDRRADDRRRRTRSAQPGPADPERLEVVQGRHVRIWLARGRGDGHRRHDRLHRPLSAGRFVDAAYMTVITMTTVGFREVRELVDWPERVWTMLLAIAGVGIIFGTIGIVAEAVLAEASSGRREAKRMAETVAALRDHYILCGYGRVGSTVARELRPRRPAGRRHRHRADVARPGPPRRPSRRRGRRDRGRRRCAWPGIERARGPRHDDRLGRQQRLRDALGAGAQPASCSSSAGPTRRARRRSCSRPARTGSSRRTRWPAGGSPSWRSGRASPTSSTPPCPMASCAFSMEELEVAAGGPLDGRTVGELRDEGIFTLAIVDERGRLRGEPAARPGVA